MKEGMTVTTHNNTKGLARAFDVRTGKLLWTFNTIPRPGEFGNDTWLDNSWAINGNAGVWTQISVDEELGPRLPAGRDADVGLLRRQAARATICSARASCASISRPGKRKWHFQFVHHPIWNDDMSSAPLLADVTIDGQAAQGRRRPEQAGVAVCLRSRHRRADLADRREARAEG